MQNLKDIQKAETEDQRLEREKQIRLMEEYVQNEMFVSKSKKCAHCRIPYEKNGGYIYFIVILAGFGFKQYFIQVNTHIIMIQYKTFKRIGRQGDKAAS